MRLRLPKWTTSWTRSWTAIRRLAETLAIGAVGGIAFQRLGLPAGLVSGSIVAASLASLLGRPLAVPHDLTRGILVIVGIVLMIVWSFWVGLIIALVGLVAFGGFAKGSGTEPRSAALSPIGVLEAARKR